MKKHIELGTLMQQSGKVTVKLLKYFYLKVKVISLINLKYIIFPVKKYLTFIKLLGTVTSINFFGSQHMLSASEDGTICIWKCKSWECEKVLKGHRLVT